MNSITERFGANRQKRDHAASGRTTMQVRARRQFEYKTSITGRIRQRLERSWTTRYPETMYLQSPNKFNPWLGRPLTHPGKVGHLEGLAV